MATFVGEFFEWVTRLVRAAQETEVLRLPEFPGKVMINGELKEADPAFRHDQIYSIDSFIAYCQNQQELVAVFVEPKHAVAILSLDRRECCTLFLSEKDDTDRVISDLRAALSCPVYHGVPSNG